MISCIVYFKISRIFAINHTLTSSKIKFINDAVRIGAVLYKHLVRYERIKREVLSALLDV